MQAGLAAVEPERAAQLITGTAPEGGILGPNDLEGAATKDQAYGMQQARDLAIHEAQLRQDLNNPNLSAADRRRIEAELEDLGSRNLTTGYTLGLAGAAGQTDQRLAPITQALASQRDPVTGEAVDITANNPNINPSWKLEDGPAPARAQAPSGPAQEPIGFEGSGGGGSSDVRPEAGPTDIPVEEAMQYMEEHPDWNIFDFIEAAGRGWVGDFGPRALDKRRSRNQEVGDMEYATATEQQKMKTIADIEKEQQEADRAFKAGQAGLDRSADMAQLNRQIAAQQQLERMKMFPGMAMTGAGMDPQQAMRAQAYSMFGMPAYPTAGAQAPGGQ
jgi:hypothetical protein